MGAATSRYFAYAKGLIALGHDVTFVLFLRQPVSNSVFTEEGISFICTFPESPEYENASHLKKLFLYRKSVKEAGKVIRSIHRNRKIDAIILLPVLIRDLLPFLNLAKSLNVKVLHERTEYPFMVQGGRRMTDKPGLYFYLHFILPQFNGIYVINRALKEYFSKILKSGIPIEVINMLVEPDRFKLALPVSEQPFEYIAYCGTLNTNKDGVDILLKAYCRALLSAKLPVTVKLLLIGDYENDTIRIKLHEIVQGNNCEDNVRFIGRVDRNKIPALLCNASALALARPANKQSEGGFPTKLGEYLATGKPVVVTDVGEIPIFLKDGYNAFIAKSGDVKSFSEKLSEVFADYPRAIEIGRRGKILAETDFNYLEQARKLASFIGSV